MSTTIGHRTWVLAGGHVPERSTGHEPERTSRDELSVLNTSADVAEVALTVYHPDRDPVGPYRLTVEAERVRVVRVGDLVDPLAVPLGEPYGLVVRSSVPVVVHALRVDTSTGTLVTTALAVVPLPPPAPVDGS